MLPVKYLAEKTQLRRTLELIEATLSVFLVLSIVALTALQIVARYGMSSPFTWTEEMSRFALIALTFIGSALISGTRGHIVVDLSDESPGPISRAVTHLSGVLVVFGSIFLAVVGVAKARSLGNVTASSTAFPLATLYWIMAAGFALMALHGIMSLFDRASGKNKNIRGI